MKPQIPTEFYKCRPIKVLNNGWILLLLSALIIWAGVCLWVLFSPQIKNTIHNVQGDEVKITVHDEQTFQELRQKHGLKATRVVVYEVAGQAFFYKDGKKIVFK